MLRLTATSAALGLVLSAGVVALAGPWDSGQRTAERVAAVAHPRTGGADHGTEGSARPGPGRPGDGPGDPATAEPGSARPDSGRPGDAAPGRTRPEPAPSAPGVLAALGAGAAAKAAAPSPAALGKRLDPLLAAPALGARRTASVIDASTGRVLYAKGATTAMTPASTIKLATTVAALSALGPDHRIPTTVVADERDARRLTLVGGGDPTLDETRLRGLARDTARTLRERGVRKVRLGYDTSLYTGPERHRIGVNDNIAPLSALMTREGRGKGPATGPAPRSADPAGDTARAFAALLKAEGVRTEAAPAEARAPKKAAQLARTRSAPLSALVEQTLTHSDNDLAEALARQTALAHDQPADFAGAGRATAAELRGLGIPMAGARLADASGLDRADRLTPAALTALLAKAADPARPALRPALTGLPVGGFTGTLAGRFAGSSPGAGLVRAKTGTLTGVNALAGAVATPDGRLLVFAFLADGTPAPDAAQRALDDLAAALTR
ncbi:D-alanyl-D-alanine carboxypeptidase/D-alanyl-D-alanine-endopeptidase [Streptomyces sp. ODS05-4]|uniref:D-alanyl-D-alanine carboxypeptidase/D-alanyl-D-alanine endopeptidase n=1 Tax=Streptomyces sp. ODS05-4 TaxID=2944939 RepID=UPI00210995F2|nr:D-alanyl-D-alanine carboxypeptidase/D-alanyl-D-alanine-endopeptidase [Streptomyces sp. ODS05-4]